MTESRIEVCTDNSEVQRKGCQNAWGRDRESSRIKGESGRKPRALHYERTACAKALRCKVLVFRGLLMVRYNEYWNREGRHVR